MSTKLQLTSVKILEDIFEEYKINGIRNKFNLQKMVNRAVDLYNTDEEFRKKLHMHTRLTEFNKNM
jgi:hypothetical protein